MTLNLVHLLISITCHKALCKSYSGLTYTSKLEVNFLREKKKLHFNKSDGPAKNDAKTGG